jgi:hypothetical protein
MRTDAPIFLSRQPAACKKAIFQKNYLTANICQNYLTIYIILKLLTSSFICRIAIQNPSIIQKVLFSPKIVFFSLDQELAEAYFSLEFIKFSQLHPVLINFRISSPSKQSKQSVDAKPKSVAL